MEEIFSKLSALISTVGQKRMVACTDIRALRVLPTGGAEKLIDFMRSDHPQVERSAFVLASDNAILYLQTTRVLEAAGADPSAAMRRSFRDAAEAERWLSEVLTPVEAKRLHQFLTESSPPID